MPQLGQARVQRGLRVVHLRRVREVDRYDQRVVAPPEHVHDPVLLAAAAEPGREAELRRDPVRAQVVLLAARLEHDGLLPPDRRLERLERRACLGRQEGPAAGLVGPPRARVRPGGCAPPSLTMRWSVAPSSSSIA